MHSTLLKVSCPDRVGLLARIANFVAEQGGNLKEVHQFTDPAEGWFFSRMEIETHTLRCDVKALRDAFEPLASELNAEWSLRPAESRPKVVLMVSKLGHCLADLLWRWRSGELAFDIPCVISNHETLRPIVEREGIPFHWIPISSQTRNEAFAEMEALWKSLDTELIVLARYMQILPAEVCARWPGRVMNIHHSFLPSFVGANPYQRAHQRGVKLIGATCHYATAELDEGPIIEQEVVRVEHFHSEADLLRLGRDCERMALARGLRYHLSERVLVRGNKTTVFRD
ncbi:MAG: formyltetrahydrofolate deformylase [Verrucomicrobia bacterium]|nr:MAG: formyltetrahydrofolate deformylase [Verrucomicrobiota bacterium]